MSSLSLRIPNSPGFNRTGRVSVSEPRGRCIIIARAPSALGSSRIRMMPKGRLDLIRLEDIDLRAKVHLRHQIALHHPVKASAVVRGSWSTRASTENKTSPSEVQELPEEAPADDAVPDQYICRG